MPNGICALALTAAMQVGAPGPSETPNFPPLRNAYNQYGFEGQFEQRFPFDTQQNWVHGYFQEIPAYGGHAFFRPYNYKDILSQSQVSAGWGHSPVMPYSQQFWHKYHDQATMLKLSRNEGGLPQAPAAPGPLRVIPAAGSRWPQPRVGTASQSKYLSPASSGQGTSISESLDAAPSPPGPSLPPSDEDADAVNFVPR